MSKTFVVMPSSPENQVNILPGQNEFITSEGVKVEYCYNVVNSTLELAIEKSNIGYSISEDLNVHDISELIEFLIVVKDHMILVNGE